MGLKKGREREKGRKGGGNKAKSKSVGQENQPIWLFFFFFASLLLSWDGSGSVGRNHRLDSGPGPAWGKGKLVKQSPTHCS